MFNGIRASSYEAAVTRKFPTSSAFDWRYFLEIAMINTTEAQRWRVFGTSVAGMQVAAIGRIFDIPEKDSTMYPRQVGPKGRTLRASKNAPFSISILPVSSDDMRTEELPPWCCGTFSCNCKLPLVNIRGKNNRLEEF